MKSNLTVNDPIYIGITEASEITGICKDNIRKIARQDGSGWIRIGKKYIIEKGDFYEWLRNRKGKEVILD